MSLRSRLTVLYTLLVVVILLLFGVAVSLFFNSRVIDLLDASLARAANIVIQNTRLDRNGQLVFDSLNVQAALPPNTYIQLRDRQQQVIYNNVPFAQQLDAGNLRSAQPAIRDSMLSNNPVRVLTAPLVVVGRPVGTLQVGTSMQIVTDTQRTLFQITLVGMIAGSLLAVLVVSLSARRVLSSVEKATGVAMRITKADALSSRIPYDGPAEDEIGQLINAFNQTLGRLESQFAAQRRFLTDVGHELRTPLTVIKGNTSLMRRMSCGDEESLASIEDEVDRLTRMVSDLLLLAQAESGKLPLSKTVVELDTLALEAMSQMSVLVNEHQKLRLGEIDQVLVCGDRDKLKQVLLNLVANAISYTPSGEVVVSVGKAGNQARLTISDNGPGIPPEDLPHIFERFYRAEKSRTRSKGSKGFGLGLSIAYWIVHNHQGRIEVDSKVGAGATFCVWLPLAEDDCPPAPASSKS